MQFDALQAELVATRRRRKKKRLGKARAALRREEEALLARIREVRAQHDALAAASPPVRSVLLRAACDPIVLRDVAVGLASGASASLAAATSDAARSLGIGLTLGDAVARACGWAEHLARRALSGLPADAVALGSAATARTGTRARAAGRAALGLLPRLPAAVARDDALRLCLLSAARSPPASPRRATTPTVLPTTMPAPPRSRRSARPPCGRSRSAASRASAPASSRCRSSSASRCSPPSPPSTRCATLAVRVRSGSIARRP